VPYQLSDGIEGRLVPRADTEGLSSAIVEILADRNLALEMGRKGRRKVESCRYSMLASNLEEIYKEVVIPN